MEKKKLVLCDTNIIIEFYKGNSEIVNKLKQIGQENIAISVVTVGELIFGALNKRELNQIKKDTSHLKVLSIDDKSVEIFTSLMSEYSLSHTLALPDGLIAATAIRNQVSLYTLNIKDFKFIEGLDLHPL